MQLSRHRRRRVAAVLAAAALCTAAAACDSARERNVSAENTTNGQLLAAPTTELPTAAPARPVKDPSARLADNVGRVGKLADNLSTPKQKPRPPAAPAGGSGGSGAGPVTPAGPWAPQFADDFSGSSLDLGKWEPYNGPGTENVGFRRPRMISVGGGVLTIGAEPGVDSGQQTWISGGMGNAGGGGIQLYGRWEIRMRVDAGKGIIPAILLWPLADTWPPEIDFAEIPDPSRQQAHYVNHFGDPQQQEGATDDANFTQWHTFGVEWTPGRIAWLVDGTVRHVSTSNVPDQKMWMAIQLDTGKCDNDYWGGCPDSSTPSRVNLQVDWVRAYRWTGDN